MNLTPEFRPLGKHRVRVEGDVVVWETHGEITQEEAQDLCERQGSHCLPLGYSLMILDATHGIHMSAGARRLFAQWMKEHRLPNCSVVIGSNFMIRGLGTLFSNAVRLLTSQQPGLHFARDEAEAWALIPETRKGLIRAAEARKKAP